MTQIDLMKADLELSLARKIFYLIRRDLVWITSYNFEDYKHHPDCAYPIINCNDVFIPASDAEPLHEEDIDSYIKVTDKFGDEGSTAWVAVKRSTQPWKPQLCSPEFYEAVKYVEELLNPPKSE